MGGNSFLEDFLEFDESDSTSKSCFPLIASNSSSESELPSSLIIFKNLNLVIFVLTLYT